METACLYCRKALIGKRPTARFCSASCRVRYCQKKKTAVGSDPRSAADVLTAGAAAPLENPLLHAAVSGQPLREDDGAVTAEPFIAPAPAGTGDPLPLTES